MSVATQTIKARFYAVFPGKLEMALGQPVADGARVLWFDHFLALALDEFNLYLPAVTTIDATYNGTDALDLASWTPGVSEIRSIAPLPLSVPVRWITAQYWDVVLDGAVYKLRFVTSSISSGDYRIQYAIPHTRTAEGTDPDTVSIDVTQTRAFVELMAAVAFAFASDATLDSVHPIHAPAGGMDWTQRPRTYADSGKQHLAKFFQLTGLAPDRRKASIYIVQAPYRTALYGHRT